MTSAVWYFARSAGIMAYLLLSASVILGVLMSARTRFAWPRFAVEEVHRFLAILTGTFVALHGASLLLDRVVPISLGQMLVPFTSPYRPFAVGLGAAAAELMAAVGISNHFRRQLPHRLWRRVHYLTLGVWSLATAHGVLAGSDRGDPWFAGIAASAVATVGLAFTVRFSVRGRAWLTGTA
jgi:methionine sulfoxide reductase heme-binding subunit